MTHTIEDLLASAVGQRPMDFEHTFVSLMQDKAGAAIEARKAELAQNMFITPQEEPAEEPETQEVPEAPEE